MEQRTLSGDALPTNLTNRQLWGGPSPSDLCLMGLPIPNIKDAQFSNIQRAIALKKLSYNLTVLGLIVVVLAVATLWLQKSQQSSSSQVSANPTATATDRMVETLQKRIQIRPQDQVAYVQLADTYLQKVRETGDPSFYTKADAALQRALELDPNSASAMRVMGALLLSRHRFQDALEWAERSLKLDGHDANTYGVLGDAQLELGLYDKAFESFQAMVDLKPNLDSYARVSYARELVGDIDGSIEAMMKAISTGPPRGESTAWSRVQLGNLYFRSGHLDRAQEQYEAALKAFDGYRLAWASLGNVRAAKGEYDKAINYYESVVNIVPEPKTVAILGDLYSKIGENDKAKLQYDTVEFIADLAAINQQVYNRELILFYADHDMKLDEALDLAKKELEVRRDIYGYDALAWALFKNGRYQEAAEAIVEAMKLGTKDSNLDYHAGKIYFRLGDLDQAQHYLERALNLNSNFSVLYSDDATETLSRTRNMLDIESAGAVS